ncbi:alpha/beta hydrolase [Actinoallomurus bryophytorum]|uniref:Pimeloyl-ACP methyl ester carboxylesterase n=1 Tax=Actinoallomurus bryophytorum TaxID=1490222 RepID=A0A543CER7_9ACTN|nr:alpha/beta fold hydrolase [Actinoallomurus bryophytorum]TQL95595.1 pimeloyl-ACP methyl ester carboxylesterase [Actinoallomurus bryophytorum]
MDRDSPTYVLIPGAWHGGWAWRPVAERLRAAGHRAICLTLPGLDDGDDATGLGLQDAVDHVVAETERLSSGQVTLVGHSWGGYPITGAAHRLADRVSKVVYYSALVPVRGRSLVEDLPAGAPGFLPELMAASPDRVSLTPEVVQRLLMQGVAEDAQRLLAELLTSQPRGYFLDALDVPDVTTLGIRAQYILSADDRALPRPGLEYAARLGLEPVMVPGTHEALLTHPDAIAEAILHG